MFGLTDIELQQLKKVFISAPEVTAVWLYGSRARGDYKPYSDLDITLEGTNLSTSSLARIEAQLDDLLLPYHIDLSALHTIRNDALLRNIHRDAVKLNL